MISEENGKYLLELAKKTIEHYLKTGEELEIPEDHPIELEEKYGVFVTLNQNDDLRGCMGYADPVESALKATIKVAILSAFFDPRFPRITEDEYSDLEFEVTVMTKPELINVTHPDQYFEEIEIGVDGLIIQKGYSRGLLLPQVAVENALDIENFLEHTCMKAGISADSWMDESCDVYKFQGQIFK